MATSQPARPARPGLTEPLVVRLALTTVALGFLFVFLFVPFVFIFVEALRNGWQAYIGAIPEPEALSAIWLTLLVAALTVPANAVFGIAAAWAIARFDFRGKRLLTTLIDLPFAVSPVVAGMIFVLLFGRQGWFGPWLARARHQHHLRRTGHRPGDRVRVVPIRGARTHPGDAGDRDARKKKRRVCSGRTGGRCSCA